MSQVEMPVDLMDAISKKGKRFLYEGKMCDASVMKILRGIMTVTRRLQKQNYDVVAYDEGIFTSYKNDKGRCVPSENAPSILEVDRRIRIAGKDRQYLAFRWRFRELPSTAQRWGETFRQGIFLSDNRDAREDAIKSDAGGVLQQYAACLRPDRFAAMVLREKKIRAAQGSYAIVGISPLRYPAYHADHQRDI